MAAEYESTDAVAEEISQPLYYLQVLMLAKGLELLEDVYRHLWSPPRPPSSNPKATPPCCESPCRTRLASPRPPLRCSTRRAISGDATRRTSTSSTLRTRSSSTCARRTSPPTSARVRSTSASSAAIWPLDARMPGAREVESLGFGDSTFRFAGPPGRFTTVQDLEGARVATAYPPRGRLPRRPRRRGRPGAARRRCRVRRSPGRGGCRRRRRLDRHDRQRQAGLEIFGPVLLQSEAVLITSPTEAEGTGHTPAPPPARRDGRPPLRHGRLRPARRPRRRRGPDRAGNRVAHDLNTVSKDPPGSRSA